jgi:hypothetical protein
VITSNEIYLSQAPLHVHLMINHHNIDHALFISSARIREGFEACNERTLRSMQRRRTYIWNRSRQKPPTALHVHSIERIKNVPEETTAIICDMHMLSWHSLIIKKLLHAAWEPIILPFWIDCINHKNKVRVMSWKYLGIEVVLILYWSTVNLAWHW